MHTSRSTLNLRALSELHQAYRTAALLMLRSQMLRDQSQAMARNLYRLPGEPPTIPD